MRETKTRLYVSFAVLLVFSSMLVFSSGTVPSSVDATLSPNADFNAVLNSLDYSEVEEHLRFLSSISTRMTGYPGCEEAAQYIYDYFNSLGLNPTSQWFNVTVPVDYGANLQLLGQSGLNLSIYPLEPNFAVPVVANGLTGPLVYVGRGDYNDIEGKVVEDAILLMDYDSDINWLKAARIGAKAVIFIEPAGTDMPTYYQTHRKSIWIPYNFPRLYIKQDDFLNLYSVMQAKKPQLVQGSITSKVVWEQRPARNIICQVAGDSNKIILFSAHYDSYSVVLSVAPGANDAIGMATVLELARLLKQPQFKPMYTVMFVAYAGHHQVLEGGRNFYRKNVSPINTSPITVMLQMGFRLSSLSDTVGTLNGGSWIFKYAGFVLNEVYDPGLTLPLNRFLTEGSTSLIATINGKTGRNFKLISAMADSSGGATGNLPETFPLDTWVWDEAEIFALNNGAGIFLRTVDYSDSVDSPLDTYERLNIENLRKNVATSVCVAYGITQTDRLQEDLLKALGITKGSRYSQCFDGVVAEYNEITDWFDPIPHALMLAWYPAWPRPMATFSLENGTYRFLEWPPKSPWDIDKWLREEAYVINEKTGNIEYAPTQGTHKWAMETVGVSHKEEWLHVGYFTVFKCGTIVLFDNTYLSKFIGVTPQIIEVDTKITPISWGISRYLATTQPAGYDLSQVPFSYTVAALHVSPDDAVNIIATNPYEAFPLGVLANTSKGNPEGAGFKLEAGQQYVIHNTALQYAKDTLNVGAKYIGGLETSNLFLESIAQSKELTQKGIADAEATLSNHSYVESFSLQMEAWKNAVDTYAGLRETYINIISVVPFFAMLLLPFVFLAERLFFQAEEGKKRILLTFVIFLVAYVFFSFQHPGFKLASNPIMVVVAFMVLLLIAPSIFVLFNSSAKSLKRLMVKTVGKHVVEISRTAAVSMAFQTGTQNLRKRSLRAALTVSTIVLVMIGITMFSSIQPIRTVSIAARSMQNPYNGLCVWYGEAGTEAPNLGVYIIDFLRGAYGDVANIQPNVWLYTRVPGDQTQRILHKITYGTKQYSVYALMGLSTSTAPPWTSRGEFNGRWFVPGEVYACILPTNVATSLGASVGDTVQIFGRNLTVAATFNPTILTTYTDINGASITPIDFRDTPPKNIGAEEIAIVTYDFSLKYGQTRFTSVNVIVTDPSKVSGIAEHLSKTVPGINFISAVSNQIFLYNLATTFTTFGWQMQIVPIVMAAFIILNIILGGVKEREREIFTYSSVGLSPLHIGFMFLAEASIYAVVGGLLGYIIAMGVYAVIPLVGLEVISTNYSSTFVVASMGIVMGLTIGSSLYAVLKASKLVTPSLERVWKIPTNPQANNWEIPIPVTLSGEDAAGALKYLREYITAQTQEIGKFSAETPPEISEEKELKTLAVRTRLAPYDQGIVQNVKIILSRSPEEDRWTTVLALERTDGEYDTWKRLVRTFAGEIRTQFLIWRTMPPKEKTRYM